jgi:hypothetical protein
MKDGRGGAEVRRGRREKQRRRGEGIGSPTVAISRAQDGAPVVFGEGLRGTDNGNSNDDSRSSAFGEG